MGIFISHAQADKALVDKFVDLLQTGLNISHENIFCTSLEGLGIPRGQTFVSFIREKMAGAEFVVMLITPRYYESAFCLCELGATWITGREAFPLLVPPLDYSSLKAVLHGVQSGAINDKNVLNELRDRLTATGLAAAATGRWESKRDEFINAFPRIQKKLSGPTVVPAATHQTVKEGYDAAQVAIEEKDAKIEELEELITSLKACKDRSEVAAVTRKTSSVESVFEQHKEDFEQATRGLPSVAVEALYYHFREEEWRPRSDFGSGDEWEEIDNAKERGLVTVTDENKVEPNTNHPKIRKALAKLDEISRFMSDEAVESFREQFEEEHEYTFSLSNREFWQKQLGM